VRHPDGARTNGYGQNRRVRDFDKHFPELRRFYQYFHRVRPYWFFFCDLQSETLTMITLCLLPMDMAAADVEQAHTEGELFSDGRGLAFGGSGHGLEARIPVTTNNPRLRIPG